MTLGIGFFAPCMTLVAKLVTVKWLVVEVVVYTAVAMLRSAVRDG